MKRREPVEADRVADPPAAAARAPGHELHPGVAGSKCPPEPEREHELGQR